jgi:predicted nuclease of predicted toxin-antitoxin system
VIWVRLGNCTTEAVERLRRTEYDAICHMHEDPALGLLTVG